MRFNRNWYSVISEIEQEDKKIWLVCSKFQNVCQPQRKGGRIIVPNQVSVSVLQSFLSLFWTLRLFRMQGKERERERGQKLFPSLNFSIKSYYRLSNFLSYTYPRTIYNFIIQHP
uniref:Uncharacterized protein n=1 Tax=Cacopsylla melanoneura TaxID=428564 RepID=A0A8D8LZF3_9HEMI